MTWVNANPPPLPTKPPEPKPSFTAYVWRGDKFDDIGAGETRSNGHLLRLHIGARPGDVIELRALDDAFNPGCRRPEFREPKPTFLAFFAGTEKRAGTAWPHEDGKGHRLKLRHAIPDSAEIELRDSGCYVAADHFKPPMRKHSLRNKLHIKF